MTCREFTHTAASLTLWELSRTPDPQIADHAGQCSKCADWLQKQRTLAASLQTLQARTAGQEAGPHVERALLRTFRQGPSEPVPPLAAHRFTPIALGLSRFFELGAYAAAAAACLVALLLGVRLLERHGQPNTATNQSVTVPLAPAAGTSEQTAGVQKDTPATAGVPSRNVTPIASVRHNRVAAQSFFARGEETAPEALSAEPAQAGVPGDYIPLMFCDPLSCASDAQVVRVEFPAPAASGREAQPEMADVVVGYDGIVRAVRMVN